MAVAALGQAKRPGPYLKTLSSSKIVLGGIAELAHLLHNVHPLQIRSLFKPEPRDPPGRSRSAFDMCRLWRSAVRPSCRHYSCTSDTRHYTPLLRASRRRCPDLANVRVARSASAEPSERSKAEPHQDPVRRSAPSMRLGRSLHS